MTGREPSSAPAKTLLNCRRALRGGIFVLLVGVATALSCTSASSTAPDTTPTPPATPEPVLSLRYLAQGRGIDIGAAVSAEPLRSESQYRQTLAREFSMVTTENALKFGPVHPEPNRYDFADADAIVDFAEANGMKVRGHTLVWHNQLPSWLTEGDFTRGELTQLLREHITTVVGRYRGRIAAWDVVNEAVADDGSLRDTIWLRGIGPEYIEMAFRWAHEADPDALLFYNDYGGEGLTQKSDAIYRLVKDLVERGVPIHGVGLQMHVSLGWAPWPANVAANMERLGALGLAVHITEMDVRVQDGKGSREELLAAQAGVYREMIDVCLGTSICKAFVTWGFTDRYSWIPALTGKPDAPLLFDASYQPKPAWLAVMDALEGR